LIKACGVVAIDEEVPWHGLLALPLLMVEAADVGKRQVFHLTLERALQAQVKLYVSCG